MLTNYWKFQNRNVQTYGFVHHDTNGQNHGPVWQTQSFLLNENLCGHPLARLLLERAIWENAIETWTGESSQLGMLIRTPWKGIIICECGWHKIGWKETQYWSDVENTQQRSWFGRTNIFPWSCILGTYSKTMRNKQRYCGPITEPCLNLEFLRGEQRNFHSPKILVFLHCRMTWWVMQKKCVERYCELANKSTQQFYKVSTPCIDDHYFKEEEMKSDGELSHVCSQIVLKCLYLAKIGRPDILWSVNKLARSISKWTKACEKRLNRFISYVHHTCEYKQYCHVGNTAKQWQIGTVSRLTSREILKLRNPILEDHFVFLEVTHLFQ